MTRLPDRAEFVSYRVFGEQFFRRAVTQERVLAAVNAVAGQPIELGPTGVGPGKLVRLTATGHVGVATGEPVTSREAIGFHVVLPVHLAFDIELALETHRFRADLSIPLVVTARALEDVRAYVDVTPPHARDVVIDLHAEGLRAGMVQRVTGMEGEIRRFVAAYVRRELERPHVRRARVIDVGTAIDAAWARIAPGERP